MDEAVVEFNLVLGQLVVVGVDLVDQLPIELQHLLELLFEQALGVLVNLLVVLVLLVQGSDPLPQVCEN